MIACPFRPGAKARLACCWRSLLGDYRSSSARVRWAGVRGQGRQEEERQGDGEDPVAVRGLTLSRAPVSGRPSEKRSGPPLCSSGPPPDPRLPEIPATKAPQEEEKLRQDGSQVTGNLRNRRSQVRILSGALSEGRGFRSMVRSPAAPAISAQFGRNRCSCPQAELDYRSNKPAGFSGLRSTPPKPHRVLPVRKGRSGSERSQVRILPPLCSSGRPALDASCSTCRPYPSDRPRDGEGRVLAEIARGAGGGRPIRPAPIRDPRRILRYSNIRKDWKRLGDAFRGQGEICAGQHRVRTEEPWARSVENTDESTYH